MSKVAEGDLIQILKSKKFEIYKIDSFNSD